MDYQMPKHGELLEIDILLRTCFEKVKNNIIPMLG